MLNVIRTFFITGEEANDIHPSIDYSMPQFELESGVMVYAHITGSDIMTYHSYDTLEDIISYTKSMDEAWNNR